MQTHTSIFGTDGIRGKANLSPMTTHMALNLGLSLGYSLTKGVLGHTHQTRKRVVLGKDTRLSCYAFEQAMTAGLCAMGVDVLLLGPMPTPGVAFLTRSMRADAGVVISASHNPFDDNGIKLFNQNGFKLTESEEKALEALILDKSLPEKCPLGASLGRAKRIEDSLGRYIEHLKSALPQSLWFNGLRLVVDCAHGAAYKAAPIVLRELDAEVYTLGIEPNGTNINHQSGAMAPQLLQEKVLHTKAHLGIALDGDADRVVLVDEKGQVVSGDAIMALLAKTFHAQQKLTPALLVATVMSNGALEETLNPLGIKVLRAPVGDRHVVHTLLQHKANLGGEESGHLIDLRHSTTGDGMLGALAVLQVMVETQKPLSELLRFYKPLPRWVSQVAIQQRQDLAHVPGFQELIKEEECDLGPGGRILVRYSGTEPKIRILVESKDANKAKEAGLKIQKYLENLS